MSAKGAKRAKGGGGAAARGASAAAAPPVMSDDEFARKLAELTPEQRAMFERALALTVKKRRVLMTGYLAAVIALILGMAWALYIFGKTHGGDQFMGWVFLVPLLVAAIVLVLFGRVARHLK